MSWEKYYRKPDKSHWYGRPDTPEKACVFQIVQELDISKKIDLPSHPNSFVFLGFSCDEGIRRNLGRLGAAEGPTVLKNSIATLPLHRDIACFDAGNIVCNDNDLEAAQQALSRAVAQLLEVGYVPIILGGGHEVAWGHFLGIDQCYGKNQLGIVNFDAHYDMRPMLEGDKGSSGTPFTQIANYYKNHTGEFHYYCIGIQHVSNTQVLIDTANQHKVTTIFANELQDRGYEKCHKLMEQIIADNQKIYLSICLDAFSSAYAPGVSAPQPLGLDPWQVLPHIREIAKSKKVVSYDIAELSPPHDSDDRTAKLAAALVHEIMHYHNS